MGSTKKSAREALALLLGRLESESDDDDDDVVAVAVCFLDFGLLAFVRCVVVDMVDTIEKIFSCK